MYVVSVTPRNVPLRNVTARQLSNVLQWNLPIVDMLEVVIILSKERFTPWRIFISHVHTYCITYMYIYNVRCLTLLASFFLPSHLSFNFMYMCVSIEAADVCLQCTRTMCNIECCRFTTVKESSVCYTYIIQEEVLAKGFYLRQHSLIPRDHTHLCEKGPFIHKWVWYLSTYMHIDHAQCRSIIVGSKWNTTTACTLLYDAWHVL